jgi:hypothetical protein
MIQKLLFNTIRNMMNRDVDVVTVLVYKTNHNFLKMYNICLFKKLLNVDKVKKNVYR